MWAEPILHVDMDSFFVEVERQANPLLRARAVAVGGTGPRGVIASASYEARRFGVRSAMATATARRLCPELIVVSPSHGTYSAFSERVFAIFRSFTPVVEGLSLDEAFLDVSGLTRHYSSSADVGAAVKETIRDTLGLPSSVGIASTKFVSKLASEAAKPDGLLVVTSDRQQEFIHALRIESLWGVGPATLAALQRFGVVTVGELAEIPEESLANALGPSQARQLLDLAAGVDHRPVTPDTSARSISVEETFPSDIQEREELETFLLAQSQRLAGRLRRAGLRARTVTVKLRFGDFRTITRSRTESSAVAAPRDLFRIGKVLLGEAHDGRSVRLVGLVATGLEPADSPAQLEFGDNDGWRQVSEAVEAAREKYGPQAIEPARLIQIPGGESDGEG